MYNKMCDIGVIPDNLVFTLNENQDGYENEYEINLNNEVFKLKDEGTDGYVLELENSDYYDDFSGYVCVKFICFEEFLSFLDVNSNLHFLYCEKCGISTLFRKDERMFYHQLKELEKLVEHCKKIEFNVNNLREHVLFKFFEGIHDFIREYVEAFKHKNKKIEKKFNKVAEILKKVTKLPPWLENY